MSNDTVNKNSACSSAFKSNWTKHEKFLLLKSLKLYGHKNIAAISTFLSNKSQDDIKDTINNLKSKSKILKKNTPLINDWIEHKLIKKKNTLIREIYRYLYKLSCNMKNIKLSKPNQDILYKAFKVIDNRITTTPQQDEIILHLKKLLNENRNIKTYPSKKATSK
ncbi:PREDICTED: uncharacterized protein LOC106784309 isoform X2 [Polistes canadensis]|uniref:uncharacterized protein LOC106784309 isoform X2 n=1 Tax=Polistes canadensis TaxID=91411 RepID=UPI000718EA66|nr:PREDICTED: uncharacterized protein LOC106784309 isoform X2 [Polistes canadensis]